MSLYHEGSETKRQSLWCRLSMLACSSDAWVSRPQSVVKHGWPQVTVVWHKAREQLVSWRPPCGSKCCYCSVVEEPREASFLFLLWKVVRNGFWGVSLNTSHEEMPDLIWVYSFPGLHGSFALWTPLSQTWWGLFRLPWLMTAVCLDD